MVSTGNERHHAAKTLRTIPEDLFQRDKVSLRQTSSTGGKPTSLISFSDALVLVQVLPGRVAKETRTQFADIIRRYLAGDHSLIKEIQANAKTASPIAQMARESMNIVTEEELTRKRRREDIELQKMQAEAVTLQQKTVTDFMEAMHALDPNWKNDTRLVIQTKDRLKNIVLGQPTAAITNGTSDNSIYIQDVARSLGHSKLSHGDACRIGKKAAELYQALHSAAPPKRLQFVDGAERMVNAYTEGDRDLLVEAVNSSMI